MRAFDVPPEALVRVRAFHASVDRSASRLVDLHGDRLHCRLGCHACCRDDLTVSTVEAANIVAAHGALLREGAAAPPGGCAMLGTQGECRVYDARPYVCRTQGLPLRWIDDAKIERRDICPENVEGEPIEELAPEACWTVGAAEMVLAALEKLHVSAEIGGGGETVGDDDSRILLRTLFEQSMVSTSAAGRASQLSTSEDAKTLGGGG